MKLHLNAKRLYDAFGKRIPLTRGDFCAVMRDLDNGIYPSQMGIQPGDYADSSLISFRLRALDILLEGNDWEAIVPAETKNGHTLCYINFGDPYVPTILYCEGWKRPFRFAPGGWGDYIK